MLGSGGKAGSIGGKITTKWSSPDSAFAIDKFEMKSNGGLVLETSMVAGPPGLKLEFKGDDSNKADLGAVFKNEAATATAELDVAEFSSLRASVFGGNKVFGAGVSTGISLGDKFDVKTIDVGASYKNDALFAALNLTKKFSEYGLSIQYFPVSKYTLAGLFNYSKDTFTATVGGIYRCCPDVSMKAKICTGGNFSASVKQTVDKSTSVVGAVQFPISDVSCFKYGVTVTLG